MAGIYGVFLKGENAKNFHEFFHEKNPIINELELPYGIVGRSTIDKLSKDRFFSTKNGITICFEGVNLSDNIQSQDDFFNEYFKEGISFIKKLQGTFSGLIYDASLKRIFVFNDNLSTKNIFYYYSKDTGFVFSSELAALTKLLKSKEISYSLNADAVYMMALYGFILEDQTYVKEVKRLKYSSILSFDIENFNLDLSNHHKYSNNKKDITLDSAIATIDHLLVNSISKNWNKDLEYNSDHISFLSGGLDAKTNVLIAKELGFSDISTITFGQSKSKDIKYSKLLATKEGFNHFERFLDYPKYLIDEIFTNYIIPNDGMIMYHSSAHASSTVRSLELHDFALLHTGQIGDVLFGSFSKGEFSFLKNRGQIGYTGFVSQDSLLDKIESLPEILNKYEELGVELYTYEQRQINATIYGDRTLNNKIDNISPFYNKELINFCLGLPPDFKKGQLIYYEWLKKYHKQVLEYPWDKIDMKPNTRTKFLYGKTLKKYVNGAKKYFNLSYESMNPYNTWLRKYPEFIEELDRIVNEELQKDFLDKELKEDLLEIYENNIFEYRNKFAVVTALLAIKLHFQ